MPVVAQHPHDVHGQVAGDGRAAFELARGARAGAGRVFVDLRLARQRPQQKARELRFEGVAFAVQRQRLDVDGFLQRLVLPIVARTERQRVGKGKTHESVGVGRERIDAFDFGKDGVGDALAYGFQRDLERQRVCRTGNDEVVGQPRLRLPVGRRQVAGGFLGIAFGFFGREAPRHRAGDRARDGKGLQAEKRSEIGEGQRVILFVRTLS